MVVDVARHLLCKRAALRHQERKVEIRMNILAGQLLLKVPSQMGNPERRVNVGESFAGKRGTAECTFFQPASRNGCGWRVIRRSVVVANPFEPFFQPRTGGALRKRESVSTKQVRGDDPA